jgi:hypothetical protein
MVDANAGVRHTLAAALEELVPDREMIAQLVSAHAPMISIRDLPVETASTIWMYILVELTNRGLFAEMSSVVQAARRRSSRIMRIDWSAFDAVLRPQAIPVVASWSHLSLELRGASTDVSLADATLITRVEERVLRALLAGEELHVVGQHHGDTLLEAVTTLQWRGVRPSDPLIEVTSYQLFGRAMPLLYEATLLPSDSPEAARWLAKIPVPRARLRTRRVTVRCAGTDLKQRRYIVPWAGSIFAAIVWFALVAFACVRLAEIDDRVISIALVAASAGWGLWSLIGPHLLRVTRNMRSFGSLVFAWELTVLPAAVLVGLRGCCPAARGRPARPVNVWYRDRGVHLALWVALSHDRVAAKR